MPHFNVEDQALVERLLTIPHRSRFFTGVVSEEPYSFAADPGITRKFQVWAPYFLRWAMVGLQEYHARRFDDVPDSCKSFKRILVAEKDVIGEFLSLTVEAHDDAKNFVRLRELYDEFQGVNKGLQRDKRSHKSYNTFKSAALQHLTWGTYKAMHSFRKEDGRSTSASSVMIGYKRKASMM